MHNIVLNFSSSISDIKSLNDSFDSGVLRICYSGRNRNKTHLAACVIEGAAPTMFNCPVVCNYDIESDEIGGHDVDIVRTNNGIKMINLTDAVGVVPFGSKYWWEEVEEGDGNVRNYFTTEVILWKRSAAYQKIKKNGITSQSMEVSIKRGHLDDDGYFVIEDFAFTAFCLLESEKPCFESASLQMFGVGELKHQLNEMMCDFKNSMAEIRLSKAVDISKHNYSEGGEVKLDDKNIADKNFALAKQFMDELCAALSVITIDTEWGEMPRYWFVDFNDEAQEVYCYDATDWRLYGFAYATNGDSVVIDFGSRRRMKFDIVEFDEGIEQNSVFSAVYSLIAERYAESNKQWAEKHDANDKQWAEKYQAASDSATAVETELGELRKFKADAEYAESERELDSVFVQFEDLAGIEEFDALRENCENFSVEDLKERCFAIRGRNMPSGKFSLSEPKPPKLMVERTGAGNGNEPYGGVFEKYGISRKQQG